MSMYDQYQFVQFDSNPLIITVVAGADANSGKCQYKSDIEYDLIYFYCSGYLINFGHKLVELAKPLASAMQERM